MGRGSSRNAALRRVSRSPGTQTWAVRATRAGRTESKRSTPAGTAASRARGGGRQGTTGVSGGGGDVRPAGSQVARHDLGGQAMEPAVEVAGEGRSAVVEDAAVGQRDAVEPPGFREERRAQGYEAMEPAE